MNSISLLTLTNIAQWTLFAGIGLIVFSWIEKKQIMEVLGELVFLILSAFGIWFLLSNNISISDEDSIHLTKAQKMLGFAKALAAFGGVTALSLLLKIFNSKFWKYSVYVVFFVALMLFFMVFNIQQSAA